MRINSILFLGGILFLILVCSEPEPDPVRTGRGYQEHSDKNKHDVQKIQKIQKRGAGVISLNVVFTLACTYLSIEASQNCGSVYNKKFDICGKSKELSVAFEKLKQKIDETIDEDIKLAQYSGHVKDIRQKIETLQRIMNDMAEINFDILTDLKVLDLSVTYERNPENQKFGYKAFFELSSSTELAKKLTDTEYGMTGSDKAEIYTGLAATFVSLGLAVLQWRADKIAQRRVSCFNTTSNEVELGSAGAEPRTTIPASESLPIPTTSYLSKGINVFGNLEVLLTAVNVPVCAYKIFDKATDMKEWYNELTTGLEKVGRTKKEADKQLKQIKKSKTKIENNFGVLKKSALNLFKVLQGDEKVWGRYMLKKKDGEEVLTELLDDNTESEFLKFRKYEFKKAFDTTYSNLKKEIHEDIEQMKPEKLSKTLTKINDECEKLKTEFHLAAKSVRIFSLVEKGVKKRDSVDKILNNIRNQYIESTEFEVLKSIADQPIGDEVYEGFPVGCIRNEKIKSAEDLTNFWSLEKGFPRLSDDDRYLLKLYSDMNLKLEWVLDFTKKRQMFEKKEKDVLLKVYANSIYPKEEYKIFGGEKIVLGEYRDDTICCVC